MSHVCIANHQVNITVIDLSSLFLRRRMTVRHFPWPQIFDNWEQSDNCNNWIWRLYIRFRNNQKALLYKLQSTYQISFRVGGYNGSNLLVLSCCFVERGLSVGLLMISFRLNIQFVSSLPRKRLLVDFLLLLVIVVLLMSSVVYIFFFKQTRRLKIKE